jgi:hypothetical protein
LLSATTERRRNPTKKASGKVSDTWNETDGLRRRLDIVRQAAQDASGAFVGTLVDPLPPWRRDCDAGPVVALAWT